MAGMLEPSTHPPILPRLTKFTPENMRQILNLVDRGKSPVEIAEIIGVTPGTLKSTCSKLRISLRRPRFDMGTGPVRQRRPRASSIKQAEHHDPEQKRTENGAEGPMPRFKKQPMDQEPTVVPQEQLRPGQQTSATFAILMRYKGEERTMELPLTHHMIAQLAIEAEFRGTAINELIASLIAEVTINDKFNLVFEQHAERYRP